MGVARVDASVLGNIEGSSGQGQDVHGKGSSQAPKDSDMISFSKKG